MCLVVNEVGSDLSQKGYGHVGGAIFACEKEYVHKTRYITLTITSLSRSFTVFDREPVLCLVIIARVKESLNIENIFDQFIIDT